MYHDKRVTAHIIVLSDKGVKVKENKLYIPLDATESCSFCGLFGSSGGDFKGAQSSLRKTIAAARSLGLDGLMIEICDNHRPHLLLPPDLVRGEEHWPYGEEGDSGCSAVPDIDGVTWVRVVI